MKIKIKAAYGLFILITILIGMGSGSNVQAAAQPIRIGCVDIDSFLEVDANGNASGYGAEYLKKIAQYTGWSYEYKSGTWAECLEWLEKGEIDLLMPAEYSEERAENYLFSDIECCLDYAALLGRKSDDNFYFEDYEAYNGMMVGMIKDNYLNTLFEAYAVKHGFAFRATYYDTGTQLEAALDQKEVDAIISGNMEYTDKQKLLARIDFMRAYFITAIDHHELMNQLNDALHQIFLYNPYYTADLYSKYYHSIERQSIGFTRQEWDFITQTDEVTVLFEKDEFPLEWYDARTETFHGVYADILKLVERESGLTFRFVVNDMEESPWELIQKGKADIWGSAHDFDADPMMKGITFTSSYYDCSYSFIGKKEKNINLSEPLTIAVLKGEQEVQAFIRKQYPMWSLVVYDSIADCLASVARSETNLAIANSWRLSADEEIMKQDLIVIDGKAMTIPICMGVSESSNPLLASVLDKAVLKIDSRELDESVFNSMLSIQEKMTLSYLVKKYPVYAALLVLLIMAAVLSGIFMTVHNMMQKKQNLILQEKNQALSEAVILQEQLRIAAQTDVLTGLNNKNTAEESSQRYLEGHSSQRHALLIIDLDNFKVVNDTYGHLFGDAVLKRFGQVLLSVAAADDIVGRIGGDEFLMFLAGVEGPQQVEERVELIYSKVAEKTGELPLPAISCSIGIIVTEASQQEFSDLFFQADKELYVAKNKGKNQYSMVNHQ